MGCAYLPLCSACSGWPCQSCACRCPIPAAKPRPPLQQILPRRLPELAAQSYRLCDKGGRVAVYRCGTDGQPEVLVTITGIYTNLLPENDALRIKRGVTVYSERELDLLLEDLGE